MTSQQVKAIVRVHSIAYYLLHKMCSSLCSNTISSDFSKVYCPKYSFYLSIGGKNIELKSSKLILLNIKRNYLSNKKQGNNAEEFFVASTSIY